MDATIVEFHPERGMGRALVDGAGELSFDASVVAIPFTELVPGVKVQVDMGPSRLGGLRIIKLTIPDAEASPPAPLGPPKPVTVGAYVLQMPDFWTGGEVVTSKNGARYTGHGPGIVFEFLASPGAGGDPAMRSKLVGIYGNRYPGPRTSENVTIAGSPFETHVFETDKMGPGSRFELNLGDVGGDLVGFGVALTPPKVPKAEVWSQFFRSIVAMAILERGQPA
jgi:hypothetical protein